MGYYKEQDALRQMSPLSLTATEYPAAGQACIWIEDEPFTTQLAILRQLPIAELTMNAQPDNILVQFKKTIKSYADAVDVANFMVEIFGPICISRESTHCAKKPKTLLSDMTTEPSDMHGFLYPALIQVGFRKVNTCTPEELRAEYSLNPFYAETADTITWSSS